MAVVGEVIRRLRSLFKGREGKNMKGKKRIWAGYSTASSMPVSLVHSMLLIKATPITNVPPSGVEAVST